MAIRIAEDRSAAFRWTARPHLSRRLRDERLVFALDSTGPPIRLNGAGSQMWDMLCSGSTEVELAEALPADVPGERRSADVTAFLDQLVAERLIVSGRGRRSTTPVRRRTPTSVGMLEVAAPKNVAGLQRWLATVESAPRPQFPLASLGEEAEIVDALEQSGSIGQLAQAIDRGWVDVEDETDQLVQDRWAANQLHCLRVEQLLLRVADQLDAAGIEFRVIKGVATSHLDLPDPSWREFGDVDLLIDEAAWTDALAVLEGSDLSTGLADPHPIFSSKGTTLYTSDGLMVDLHRRLNVGGLGSRADAMFDDPDRFRLAGRVLVAPSSAARLVHALLHWFASINGVRPATLRDVSELRDADVGDIALVASSLGLTGVVEVAATELGSMLGLPELVHLGSVLEPSRLERIVARRRDLFWRELTGVLTTPGVRGRARYVRRRVFVPESARREHGITFGSYRSVLRGRVRPR